MRPKGQPRPEAEDLQDRRDRKLIEQIAAGEEAALSELLSRYGPAVIGLAKRIVGDPGLAEEVGQEVFVSVWRRAGTYEVGRGSVRTWLLAQAHHRAVDAVRHEDALRRRSTRAVEITPPTSPDDVVEERWLADQRLRVRNALEGLVPEQRQVLELAYFGGLTQTQVAQRLGAPLGTVKSRTLTAMRKLRLLLDGSREE